MAIIRDFSDAKPDPRPPRPTPGRLPKTKLAQRDEEIAAVMEHEIAHNTCRLPCLDLGDKKPFSVSHRSPL